MHKNGYAILCAFTFAYRDDGTKVSAYDIEVKNADGVTIYYNFINDSTELEVTNGNSYSGNGVIPESVTHSGNTYSVTTIGPSAFSSCSRLTTLYSLNTTPPTLTDYYPFTSRQYTSVNVYVPQEVLEAYKSADGWSKFRNLYVIGDVSTAVMQPHTATNAETVTVYTLEGRVQTMKEANLQSLPSGLYIVNGKKVVVK